MNTLKKLICLLAALILLFSFAACGGGNDTDKEPSSEEFKPFVALVIHGSADEYNGAVAEGFTAYAEKLGYKAVIDYAEDDGELRNTIKDNALDFADGIAVIGGGQSYSYFFLKLLLQTCPELKLVTLDTPFGDGNIIDGVTELTLSAADAMKDKAACKVIGETLIRVLALEIYGEYVSITDEAGTKSSAFPILTYYGADDIAAEAAKHYPDSQTLRDKIASAK